MRHRYGWLDPALVQAILAGVELVKLFNKLVLAAGGDPETAIDWMKELQERGYIDDAVDLDAFYATLHDRGVLAPDEAGAMRLSGAGLRQLRRDALEEVFSTLSKGRPGYHPVVHAGEGVERLPETRPYVFGDELFGVDAIRSTENALKRTMGGLDLAEEDLEVHETEHLTACATVVAIDVSHSMVLYGEDRITPAKTVALALVELIKGSYPKDWLGVLAFGDRAQRIGLGEIATVQAGPYHTNTAEALAVARRMLAQRKHPNKQVFLITDGKPSAITEGQRIYKNPIGLDMKIVTRTLDEADRCRRDDVVITTFMIATDPLLRDFVSQLTKVNRGRAYFASPTSLGEYILADFITHRRRRLH